MREIKFRAWDKEYSYMIQPDDIYPIVMNECITGEGKVLEIVESSSYLGTETSYEDISDKRILMQYTGLKDCNGKEIYEADIVEYCECVDEYTVDGPYIGTEVVFEDGIFCFKNDCPNPLSIYVNLKVVGNIYENPELVKP